MKGYIYFIINKKNGKRYVGQTIDIKSRKEKHYAALRHNYHHSHKLQRSYNKYGEENFDFQYEIYEIESQEDLFTLEIKTIEKYNSYYDGYNETLGGEGHITRFDLKTCIYIYQIGKRYDGVMRKISKYFDCDKSTIKSIFNREYLEDEEYDKKELDDLILKIGLTKNELRENYLAHNTKQLSLDAVLEILSILELTNFSQSSCATAFNTTKDVISGIVRGRTYKKEKEIFDSLSMEEKQEIINDSSMIEDIEILHYKGKRAPVKNPLTQEQVNYILDNKDKMTITEIAKNLNVSIDRVSSVKRKQSYQDYIHIYERLNNKKI